MNTILAEFVKVYDNIDLSTLTEEELAQYSNMGNNMMLEADEELYKRKNKGGYDEKYLQEKVQQATPMLKRGDLQELLNAY